MRRSFLLLSSMLQIWLCHHVSCLTVKFWTIQYNYVLWWFSCFQDQCFNCEKSAWKQCSACAHEYRSEERTAGGFDYVCDSCSHVVHSPKSRSNHVVQSVAPPPEVADLSELDLLSVICIETSHYVCFVHWEKRWIFFDSMANRVCKLVLSLYN